MAELHLKVSVLMEDIRRLWAAEAFWFFDALFDG
jgi:hypothetical protein